jgi:hypothetical protein
MRGLLGVKRRNTRIEHMSSGLPPIAEAPLPVNVPVSSGKCCGVRRLAQRQYVCPEIQNQPCSFAWTFRQIPAGGIDNPLRFNTFLS